MNENPYIVYIKVNSDNYIISVNSSAFLTNLIDWIKIDEGYGDKYHHAQSNYFNKPIMTELGAYNYKLIDNEILECSDEEITKQEQTIQESINSIPSQSDLIEAQIMYTAMMTDTLLE